MKAYLIGEKSAGMTAVEIYNNDDDLVWSHRYFDNGATRAGYINGLCQVWDDMHDCTDVEEYGGGYIDEDGTPSLMDDGDTTGVMLLYDSESDTWTIGDDARILGQSSEIVDACIIAGLIDDDSQGDLDDDTTKAIAGYISMR